MNGSDFVELIFPTMEHRQQALDYIREHEAYGEEHLHGSGGIKDDDYVIWLEKITNAQTAASGGWVNCSTYFGCVDGSIVGMLQIRHELNDNLLNTGGHIGYGVRPSERRKGYASAMLDIALDRCKQLNIPKVLITCRKENIASAKTIIKGGGILENEFVKEDGGVISRYWIDINRG